MQFNPVSGSGGIVHDIDFLCDTDSTSYPLVDKARNANRWLYKAIAWMFESSPLWSWDDSNQTTLPIARTTLVASQQDYSLPSDMLGLQKVTVLNAAGNEIEVYPLGFDEFKARTLLATNQTGIPSYYCVRGGSILLFPAPDAGVSVTLSNGLRLYVTREADVFTSSDTTQEPGIPEPFHRILSLGASSDFWFKYDPKKSETLLAQVMELKRDLQKFCAGRIEDVTPSLRRRPKTHLYT